LKNSISEKCSEKLALGYPTNDDLNFLDIFYSQILARFARTGNSISELKTNTPHALESGKKPILELASQVDRSLQGPARMLAQRLTFWRADQWA
jgi:hypothetical protein